MLQERQRKLLGKESTTDIDVKRGSSESLTHSDYSALNHLPSTIDKLKRSSRSKRMQRQLDLSMRVIERALFHTGDMDGGSETSEEEDLKGIPGRKVGPTTGTIPGNSTGTKTLVPTSTGTKTLGPVPSKSNDQDGDVLESIVSDLDSLMIGINRWASDQI
jgi:hypothetical protein